VEMISSKLGEVVQFQRGFDITKKQMNSDGQYKVISSSGFHGMHDAYKVAGPGVIIGRKGTLGTVHFVEAYYWPHDTTLWVKNFFGNDPLLEVVPVFRTTPLGVIFHDIRPLLAA
jgi:type I restriction enzyme S subunit